MICKSGNETKEEVGFSAFNPGETIVRTLVKLQTKAGGAYIQLQPNLNRDAANRAAQTRKGACDAAKDKCK